MKKKIVIVLLVLLCIIISSYGVLYLINRNKNKNEAVELFNEYAFYYIDLEKDVKDIDEVRKKLMELRYVKSVELISNEKHLNDFKEYLKEDELDIGDDASIFRNSFIMKFQFEPEDLDNIYEIEKELYNEIKDIEEVEKISDSMFYSLINVYNDKGFKELKSYCRVYEETKNMDSEEILKYYETHPEYEWLLTQNYSM